MEPELSCAESHLLVNSTPRKRFLTRPSTGHLFAQPFIIDVNSHPDLCLHKGEPSRPGNQPQPAYVGNAKIPADSVLPTPSSEVTAWLAAADADKAAGGAFTRYLDAAAPPDPVTGKRKKKAAKDPLASMRDARKAFWESTMKLALSDPGARLKLCARVDLGASCADVIQTKTLDEIYASARKAMR